MRIRRLRHLKCIHVRYIDTSLDNSLTIETAGYTTVTTTNTSTERHHSSSTSQPITVCLCSIGKASHIRNQNDEASEDYYEQYQESDEKIIWSSVAESNFDQLINASFMLLPSLYHNNDDFLPTPNTNNNNTCTLNSCSSDNMVKQQHTNITTIESYHELQFVIRIKKGGNSKNDPLDSRIFMEEIIDLSDLAYVGKNMTSLCVDQFPLNCLFLEFVDGIFISRDSSNRFVGFREPIHPSSTSLNISFNNRTYNNRSDNYSDYVHLEKLESTIKKLVGLQYAIEYENEHSSELKTSIEQSLAKSDRVRLLKQRISSKHARVEKLQNIYDDCSIALQLKQKQQSTKSHYIETHVNQLTESSITLSQQATMLTIHESAKIPKLRSQLDIIVNRCERRQAQIASLVAKCFTVAPEKNGRWLTINGLTIFKNEQLNTDDEAASALGFVCQCIRIFSKLYQIPLKFQVFPLASRSFVRDDDITDQKMLLPLFIMRASEKPKYYRAVVLLHKNICHILKVRGVNTTMKNKFDVLESLELLLSHASSQ